MISNTQSGIDVSSSRIKDVSIHIPYMWKMSPSKHRSWTHATMSPSIYVKGFFHMCNHALGQEYNHLRIWWHASIIKTPYLNMYYHVYIKTSSFAQMRNDISTRHEILRNPKPTNRLCLNNWSHETISLHIIYKYWYLQVFIIAHGNHTSVQTLYNKSKSIRI